MRAVKETSPIRGQIGGLIDTVERLRVEMAGVCRL